MKPTIVTGHPRPALSEVDELAAYGVATVHEALGRVGYLGPSLRPIQQGVRTVGTAVTVCSWPGDNLMIHAAVEQCRPGDVLVVTTTSECSDGAFGELFATALSARGVRGLVTTTGVRDTAELREMNFAVWSRAVSAQGTVKATAGSVNTDIVVGGQLVCAGDVILADDDGVMVVPANRLAEAIELSAARERREAEARAAFRRGELGLDRYGLRTLLTDLGTKTITYEEYRAD